MSNYQSFPKHVGSSDSLSKLYCLALPPLLGKSFLDVGCNEGYFCGYAFFNGAKKVTGIDNNPKFIQKAKSVFPFCNFIKQHWDDLPEEKKYDVILCASALHYSDDQPALVDKLVGLLKPNGILVLEVGIAPGNTESWVEVKRSIDTRVFPTWPAMTTLLEKYAFKCMGESVEQAGDPLPRKIFHITKRKPYAVLLMNKPGSGKSSMARELFKGVPQISLDKILVNITNNTEHVSDDLRNKIQEVSNPSDPSLVINHLFSCNAWQEFLILIVQKSKQMDFIFDGFIHQDYQDIVTSFFKQEGYFVVNVDWEAASQEQNMKLRIISEAKKYTMFLTSYMKSIFQ